MSGDRGRGPSIALRVPSGGGALARALGVGLGRANIRLAADALEKLAHFHELLRAADAELNLTRLRSFEAIVEKHYVDSLLPLTMVKLQGRIMDLGSGGGFPGIPIAIARPDLRIVLVEGRRRRTEFLEQAAMLLGLGNVEVVTRKLNPRDVIAVDGAIVRAVAPSAELLERLASSVRPGGVVALWKGPGCDEELAGVSDAKLPFALVNDVAYSLPSGDARRLLVWSKTAEAATESSCSGAPVPGALGGLPLLESEQNARFRHWRSLVGGHGVRKHGESLLAGRRLVEELLAERPEVVRGVLVARDGVAPALAPEGRCWALAPALWRAIDEAGSGGPIAWVAAPELEAWTGRLGRCTVLVGCQQPENVGAILRSAAALGASDVVLLEGAASPWHPRALRASGPAAWRLPLSRGPALQDLSALPGLWALDPGGESLEDAALGAATGLVIGREGGGVAAVHHDIARASLPMTPGNESLNAAVAGALAMATVWRRRGFVAADGSPQRSV